MDEDLERVLHELERHVAASVRAGWQTLLPELMSYVADVGGGPMSVADLCGASVEAGDYIDSQVVRFGFGGLLVGVQSLNRKQRKVLQAAVGGPSDVRHLADAVMGCEMNAHVFNPALRQWESLASGTYL